LQVAGEAAEVLEVVALVVEDSVADLLAAEVPVGRVRGDNNG
jgi:hypothetical protein